MMIIATDAPMESRNLSGWQRGRGWAWGAPELGLDRSGDGRDRVLDGAAGADSSREQGIDAAD